MNYNVQKIQSLFGNANNYNCDENGCVLYYNLNYISADDYPNHNNAIGRLEVNDTSWTVTVKGLTFTVGDPLSKFQAYFGSEFKTFAHYLAKDVIMTSFNYSTNDFDGFMIDFDKETKLVKCIVYYRNP